MFGINEVSGDIKNFSVKITKKGVVSFFEKMTDNIKTLLLQTNTIAYFIEKQRNRIEAEINDRHSRYFILPIDNNNCEARTKTEFAEELYEFFKYNPEKETVKIKLEQTYDYHW